MSQGLWVYFCLENTVNEEDRQALSDVENDLICRDRRRRDGKNV